MRTAAVTLASIATALLFAGQPAQAKAHPRVSAAVVGEDDLIGRQGYPKSGRKDDESAGWAVADDWQD